VEAFDDRLQVDGKYPLDQTFSRGRETNHHDPVVLRVALALNQAIALQIVDHGADVPVAAQKLAPEITLRQRAQVKQRFENRELAVGKPLYRDFPGQKAGHRLGRPQELDVGIQCPLLASCPSVMSTHRALPLI
jgi:hypothetical protein